MCELISTKTSNRVRIEVCKLISVKGTYSVRVELSKLISTETSNRVWIEVCDLIGIKASNRVRIEVRELIVSEVTYSIRIEIRNLTEVIFTSRRRRRWTAIFARSRSLRTVRIEVPITWWRWRLIRVEIVAYEPVTITRRWRRWIVRIEIRVTLLLVTIW